MNHKVFIVGRNPNVTGAEIAIPVNDPTNKVSSNHCRITWDGHQYFIEDLISTNGTFVDGNKISSRAIITENNNIRLGGSFIFYLNNSIIQSNIKDNTQRPQNDIEYSFKDQNTGKEYSLSLNTGGPFFTFINPLISFIDSGKLYKNPVYWLYTFFAICWLILPVAFIATSSAFNEYVTGKTIFALVLFFVVLAFNSWIIFQLLWNRRAQLKLNIIPKYNFKAIPIVSDIIKTYGEVAGISISILGFGASLIYLLLYSWDEGIRTPRFFRSLQKTDVFGTFEFLSLDFTGISAIGLFLYPIYGYLIILFFKFIAEFILTLPSIANNTKK